MKRFRHGLSAFVVMLVTSWARSMYACAHKRRFTVTPSAVGEPQGAFTATLYSDFSYVALVDQTLAVPRGATSWNFY